MNIAFVSKALYGGGAERFVSNMVNFLSEDLDINVFSVTEKTLENEYLLNKKVIRKDFLKARLYLRNVFKLVSFVRKNKIDILVGIDIEPNLLVCMAKPFIKAKCVISERNAPKEVNISKISRILRFCFYRFSSGYIFQTEGAKSFYSRKIQKRSVVIHNPIKQGLPYKTNADKKEIVAIGRLSAQKNYPLLLRAFAKVHSAHPDYTLRIFGEGGEKSSLCALCKELGISGCVIFEGFCLNVHDAIKDSQIFVMTSDFEGMPNALLEAMAMGFPVVSSDCPAGGPAELISNGENGLLFPVGDEKMLSDCLCRLIENPVLRKKLSDNAMHIRDSHNISEIICKWKAFLSEYGS